MVSYAHYFCSVAASVKNRTKGCRVRRKFLDKLRVGINLNVMFRPISVVFQVAGLAVGILLLQGSRTAAHKKPEAQQTTQAITATILRLEDLLDEAESHHRVATVEQLIADNYWGITVGGGVITKRDVLTAVGGREETSSQSSERQVRPLENAAVYTALVIDRGTDSKTQERYLLATRVMDIWQKHGGEWKLVNDQATGVTLDSVAERRLRPNAVQE